jgi:hypothetical protein
MFFDNYRRAFRTFHVTRRASTPPCDIVATACTCSATLYTFSAAAQMLFDPIATVLALSNRVSGTSHDVKWSANVLTASSCIIGAHLCRVAAAGIGFVASSIS